MSADFSEASSGGTTSFELLDEMMSIRGATFQATTTIHFSMLGRVLAEVPCCPSQIPMFREYNSLYWQRYVQPQPSHVTGSQKKHKFQALRRVMEENDGSTTLCSEVFE